MILPFVTQAAPAYEDDLALLPAHRRFRSLLDRACAFQLGDCVFAVPPELIRVRGEAAAQKTYPLRQPTPITTQAGYEEREIHVTLYVTTVEEINGFACPGPAGSVYHMDGLRPLIAMIQRCPLLPVVNQYLNLVHGIYAVMVSGVLVQTVEGFPGVLAVDLTMRPVAMEPYLMRASADFAAMINWPLFRWHYQRACGENVPGASDRQLPLITGDHMDDRLAVSVVDIDHISSDPNASVPYVSYPLPDGIYVRQVSVQFQNILAPLQTQLCREPTYQYFGAMETTVLMQLDCADQAAAQALADLRALTLSYARSHHNRIVTSPVKLYTDVLNVLGITDVMIESVDATTTADYPGLTQVTLGLSSFSPSQSRFERLSSYTPASAYPNLFDSLQTGDPTDLNFIEQSLLVEQYLATEQLYPDLDLPRYETVDAVVTAINAQRAQAGLPPIPGLPRDPEVASPQSHVDADFWMTYPGLSVAGTFDLSALDLPPDFLAMAAEPTANILHMEQVQGGTAPTTTVAGAASSGTLGSVPLSRLPHMTLQQINDFLYPRVEGKKVYSRWWTPSTNPYTNSGTANAWDAVMRTAEAFLKLQSETGVSAAFWIAVAAHESGWGTFGASETRRANSATASTWNFFSYDIGNASYKNLEDGIIRGGKDAYDDFVNGKHLDTIDQWSEVYPGPGEQLGWLTSVTEICVMALEKTGQNITMQVVKNWSREGARERARVALEQAGELHARPYQYFDIKNTVEQDYDKKPRQITDRNELLSACMHNMVRYNHRGRLTRAFPTFLLAIIDEGGMDVKGRKVFANYYLYHSLLSLDLIRERNNPADVLTMTLTNVYGTLNWRVRHTIPELTGVSNWWQRIMQGLQPNLADNTYLLEYRKKLLTHFDLRPGMRVHLRLGYSANPLMLPVVFNGNITEVEFGDTIEVIAQGDGRELLNQVVDQDGDAPYLGDTLASMLVNLFTRTSLSLLQKMALNQEWSSWIGARQASQVSAFGLEHWGPMRLKTVLGFTKTSVGEGGDRYGVQYERYKNVYPADFKENVYKKSERWAGVVQWLQTQQDRLAGALGFDQYDDDESLVYADVAGKTVWDLMKICETAAPGYVCYPVYHGFDSRVFFGRYLYNCIYGWRVKPGRQLKLGQSTKDDFEEVYRPFLQFHAVNSLSDIVGNGLRTTSDFPTVAVGIYGLGGKGNQQTVPEYADFAMRPDMQRVETVDLGIYRDNFGPDLITDFFIRTRDLAIAATRNHLAKRMGDMYTGEIIILGDPAMNPGDIMHLLDTYWNMGGNVWIDRVIHHMSVDGGFVTSIEPKLIALSLDQIQREQKAEYRIDGTDTAQLTGLLGDFSAGVSDYFRRSFAVSIGLIATGALRAALVPEATLAGAIGTTAGQVLSSSLRLVMGGALKAVGGTARFGMQALSDLFGVTFRHLPATNTATIQALGSSVSRALSAAQQMIDAASTIDLSRAGITNSLRVAAGATGTEAAGTLFAMNIPFLLTFVATWVLGEGLFYWWDGVVEKWTTSRHTVVILPLAYRYDVLVAGIEGWQNLIPGYPDPKYTVEEGTREEAEAKLGLHATDAPDEPSGLAYRQSTVRVTQGSDAGFEVIGSLPKVSYRFLSPFHEVPHQGVTSEFGPRSDVPEAGSFHYGIDLACPVGTPIYAIGAGTVTGTYYGDSTYGNWVTVEHRLPEGYRVESRYCHLSKIVVAVGDSVTAYTQIGESGNTGLSTGPHLHLGTRIDVNDSKGYRYCNPRDLLAPGALNG